MKRAFIIWTATQRLRVEARSLARAVALCGIDESQTPILVAAEERLAPSATDPDIPYLVAVLTNPNYRTKAAEDVG